MVNKMVLSITLTRAVFIEVHIITNAVPEWFLEVTFMQKCMRVCVYARPRRHK